MCVKIICPICHKPTFAGCGKHIEQVLKGISLADRCSGHDKIDQFKLDAMSIK